MGPEHESVADTRHNIGNVYQSLSKYEEALEQYQLALAIEEAKLGPDHPSSAMTANNISSVYAVFGDHPRALAWAPNARSSPTSTNTISVLASLPLEIARPASRESEEMV